MRRTFKNITNLPRFLENIGDGKVTFGSDGIHVEWTDKLENGLKNAIPVIQSYADIARGIQDLKMGKLASVAQRIAETRKKLESEADKLAGRLDDMDKKAPEAFNRAHTILDSHNADIDDMDAELRQLSNIPLG